MEEQVHYSLELEEIEISEIVKNAEIDKNSEIDQISQHIRRHFDESWIFQNLNK